MFLLDLNFENWCEIEFGDADEFVYHMIFG